VRQQIKELSSSAASSDPNLLRHKLTEVKDRLQEYQQCLEETIKLGRALDRGEAETLQVQALSEQLETLEDEIENKLSKAGWAAPSLEVGKKPSLGESLGIKGKLDQLVITSGDLNDAIHTGLNRRIDASQKDYKASFAIVLVISIGGSLLLIGLLRRFYCWVFYPIRDLEIGAEQIALGNFENHIEVHSGDEMEELANAFNHMKDRLRDIYADLNRQVNERSRQLVRSERLASVGFLAAGVAHEINNPLASILFCSEALEHRLVELLDQAQQGQPVAGRRPLTPQDRETMSRYMKMIQNESLRCKEITQRLLDFSRGGERRREPADLNELTQGVLDTVQHLPNAKAKHIIFQPAGRLTAWVNAQEIKSVVLNLVVNALDSMDEGGTLTITQRQYDGMAELMFQDTGCGMPAEVLENIFEPFFTRSRTGKGTGLGLSISHRVINQHGGDIEASSAGPNRGSTFVVRLPLTPAADAANPPAEEIIPFESKEENYYLRKFAA
jgi:signal transduction histidine kinase